MNVRFVADKALHLVNASHTSTRSENNVEFVLASKGDTEGGNAGGGNTGGGGNSEGGGNSGGDEEAPDPTV